MTWQTWSSRSPTSSWKVYVSVCWKVAHSFLPLGPAPTVPTQTWGEGARNIKKKLQKSHFYIIKSIYLSFIRSAHKWVSSWLNNMNFRWFSAESISGSLTDCRSYQWHQFWLIWAWPTCDLLITWLASSWMENFTPNSEEKELMGDKVPDVSTMLCTEPLKSEKAWEVRTQTKSVTV